MTTTATIRVPATTANLGAGFDCIGAALSLYNEFTLTAIDASRRASFDPERLAITVADWKLIELIPMRAILPIKLFSNCMRGSIAPRQ